jgi:hypothetical protein
MLSLVTAVLLAVLTSAPRAVRAEGSDDMGPIVHPGPSIAAPDCVQGMGICQGLRRATGLRVDILEDTETFVWTGLGDVTVISPAGDPVNGGDGDNVYASGEAIHPLAGVTGAYRVILAEQQFECGPRPAVSECPTSIQTFHRWDVTVFDAGGMPRTGRLWSLAWGFNAGNFSATRATTASFYALVPGGFADTDAVIELRLEGLAGFLYLVAANRQGPESSDGLSRGRSLPQMEALFVPEFPVYLGVPAIARYGRVGDDAIQVTGLECQAGPPGDDGAVPRMFQFDTNVTGTFQIICDLDDPPDGGSLTDDDDLVLIGAAVPGTNMVPWNGLNAAGDPVPPGPYACTARVTSGEFHYVAGDIETSFPGMRMFEVEEDQDRRPLSMFWNDSAVQSGGAIMVNGETSPVTSPAAGLFSGAAGDPAIAFSVENPDGNARAWGQFQQVSKGDFSWLDTFVWLAAAEEALVGCADFEVDDNPPVVEPPPDITVEAEGPLTPVDLGTATATDPEDGPVTATADATGPFPLGTTVVTWSATDAAGNTGTATQTVTVVDTTPPAVVAPPDITVEATGPLTDVDLRPDLASADDLVDGASIPTADMTGPFGVGTHIVLWSATDASGNTGTAIQTIVVQAPLSPIQDLRARAKSGKVDLVWTPVPGAVGYDIYRRANGGPFERIAQGHVTSYAVYADFGLTNGVTYGYVVRWLSADGRESPDSNEASAIPRGR